MGVINRRGEGLLRRGGDTCDKEGERLSEIGRGQKSKVK